MSTGSSPKQYLLGTASAGVTTGTGQWFPIQGGPEQLSIWFRSIGTTSGGTVLIEETDDPDDASGATASQLYSQAASGFTGTAKLALHIAIGAGAFIRARISSDITGGGSIKVTMIGAY